MAWIKTSVFDSGLFIFEIGPKKSGFVVHSEVFTNLSPYFDHLINGDTAEAKAGRAVWENIDISIFKCLCQFAYTGSYDALVLQETLARAKKDKGGGVEDSPDDVAENSLLYEYFKFEESNAVRADTGHYLRWRFISTKEYSLSYDPASKVRDPRAPAVYIDHLWHHVNMYFLGGRLKMESLREFALHKLWWTLQRVSLKLFPAVLTPLQWAFSMTTPADPMRGLIARFLACVRCLDYTSRHSKLFEDMVPEEGVNVW